MDHDSLQSLLTSFPKPHAMLMFLLDELLWPMDLFEMEPTAHALMDMYAMGVRPEYRGRGIAGQLIQQAFKVMYTCHAEWIDNNCNNF